jgi:putative PEP-CTERM system TPR-repeat lipoprotein
LSHLAQGEAETAFRELEQAASTGSDLRADYALIAAHVRQRDYDKALSAVARLEQKQPKSPIPHGVRGGVLIAKGDLANARKQFERALEIDPGYFPAVGQLARLDLAENKTDAARQRLEGAVAKDPKKLQALLALADLRSRTGGNSQEVAGLIQKAIAVAPADPAPRLALVQHYLNARDPKNAMLAAQQAMAAIPNRPEILDAAGTAHLAAGETSQAVSIYRKLAALEPKSPLPLVRIAQAQFAAQNKDEAIENLRKALELSPNLPEAQQGLVRLYTEAGRTKEALAIAREAQKRRPKDALGYALEGDVYLVQKNWNDAVNAYRNGLKHVDSTDLAVRVYAALGAGSGGAPAANDFAAGWLKTHPQDQGFRLSLAESALAAKQYATAIQHYRKMLESAPKNAIALNNLAWAEFQLKDPKAIEHAEEANRVAPNQPAIMDTLGMLLVDKGDTARGVDLLQKAVTQAPQASGIRLNLAKALVKAGQKDAARKELDELAKLGDKFPAQAEVEQLKRGL